MRCDASPSKFCPEEDQDVLMLPSKKQQPEKRERCISPITEQHCNVFILNKCIILPKRKGPQFGGSLVWRDRYKTVDVKKKPFILQRSGTNQSVQMYFKASQRLIQVLTVLYSYMRNWIVQQCTPAVSTHVYVFAFTEKQNKIFLGGKKDKCRPKLHLEEGDDGRSREVTWISVFGLYW